MLAETNTARTAVLVVEDEPLLLMDAVDLVEEAGLVAYGAANADEAIRILETRPDIAVLFTDVDMPGSMDGLGLARAVRERWPPVSIVVASGHVRVRDGDLPADGLFFSKPYKPAAVAGAIARLASPLAA